MIQVWRPLKSQWVPKQGTQLPEPWKFPWRPWQNSHSRNGLQRCKLPSNKFSLTDKGGTEESFIFLRDLWKIFNTWLQECQQKIADLVAIFPEFDFCHCLKCSAFYLRRKRCEVCMGLSPKKAHAGCGFGTLRWGWKIGLVDRCVCACVKTRHGLMIFPPKDTFDDQMCHLSSAFLCAIYLLPPIHTCTYISGSGF